MIVYTRNERFFKVGLPVYSPRVREKRPVAPAFLLFFLSPIVAELLTSSSPPVLFFTPFGLTVMTALYGSGAILARELAIRWKKGWPTLVALGAAYGMVEEGLMVKSFFDPNWPGIGALGRYGRLAGVNWVWSVELTIFHALFSIVIPNILVNLVFPKARDRRVTGEIGFAIFCAVLAAAVALGGLAITKFAPPPIPYVLTALCVAGLVVLARVLPKALLPGSFVGPDNAAAAPLQFLLLGLGGTVLFFVLSWVVPGLPVPPIVTVLLVLDLVCGVFVGVWQMTRRYSFCALNQWGIASGALAFFILLAPLVQLDRNRTNVQGMAFVGLAMAVFLALVLVLVGRRRTP